MAAALGTRRTLTALFTDIEASTRLWDEHPDRAPVAIDLHDRLVSEALARHRGTVAQHTGDGMLGRFDDPADAVRAALDAQRTLQDADWGDAGAVKVRMGIHVGEVVERPEGLVGWALNFCSRLTDIGHGGQILLSDALVAELGADALGDAEIRDLGEYGLRDVPGATRVFQLVASDLPSEFPPPRKTIATSRTVPQRRAPLFGRDREVDDVLGRIAARSLVTVTGPPGIGKTRLCIEVAQRLAVDPRAPELLWCDLAGVASDDVVAAVMTTHAIAVRPAMTALDSLVGWLSERQAVLLLDRCDECLDAVDSLAAAVVQRAPKVSLVATRGQVLGVRGEAVVRLGPLDEDAAVEMFLERAVAAGAPPAERSLAQHVCDLVDRLPFAIELAAANAAIFSTLEVRDALLANGFTAVGAGERARTVEDAVALAVDALDEGARSKLVAASVFDGSFDSAAFAAVCEPDVASGLSSTLVQLVDASLLQPITDDGRSEFRLLDSVRAVVRARADDAQVAAARIRLCTHTLAVSEQAAAGLRGPSEQRWLRVFDRQFDVMRGVFHRAVAEGDVETAVALATEQWEWAFFRFNSEYFDWGRLLLERLDRRDDARLAAVHGVVALGCWFRDEFACTTEHGNEALRRERELGAPFSLPARLALINATVFAGADAPPADVFAESDAYHRSRPEGFYRMNAEAQNSIMATWLGQHDVAEARAIKALRIGRESGNPTSIAYALWVLGQAIEPDDPEWAEHLFDESLQGARDVDNRWIVNLVQTSLASSRRRTSGPLAAAGLLDDLLNQLMRAGHWAQVWNVVRLVALVTEETGDDDLAYQLAAASTGAELAFPAFPADARAVDEMVGRIADRRGAAWTRRASRIAATWSPTDAARAARAGLARIVAA